MQTYETFVHMNQSVCTSWCFINSTKMQIIWSWMNIKIGRESQKGIEARNLCGYNFMFITEAWKHFRYAQSSSGALVWLPAGSINHRLFVHPLKSPKPRSKERNFHFCRMDERPIDRSHQHKAITASSIRQKLEITISHVDVQWKDSPVCYRLGGKLATHIGDVSFGGTDVSFVTLNRNLNATTMSFIVVLLLQY